jgi:hypothetical protein
MHKICLITEARAWLEQKEVRGGFEEIFEGMVWIG